MTGREMIQKFVESMTQLMTLMQHEIEVLKTREYGKLEELQRRKAALSRDYEAHQTAIQKNMAVLNDLSGEERGELRALYTRFRETLSENMLALKAAQDAADRAVKMVVDGVKKARGIQGEARNPGKPVRGYGAYAQAGSSSFAVNRTT